MKGPLDNACELLELAREDLVAGSAILATGDAMRAVCFHAQQAAEKSIKGLLSARDLDYPWRHDLKELVGLGVADWPDLGLWIGALVPLTIYAVESRYGQTDQPSVEKARQALETARAFYGFVGTLLAQEEPEDTVG